ERLEARGVAVVDGCDARGAGEPKAQLMPSARHELAVSIHDLDPDVAQVLSVARETRAVRAQHDAGGWACGASLGAGPAPLVLVGHDLELARFVHHVIPAEAVFEAPLLAATQALAVEE